MRPVGKLSQIHHFEVKVNDFLLLFSTKSILLPILALKSPHNITLPLQEKYAICFSSFDIMFYCALYHKKTLEVEDTQILVYHCLYRT